MDTDTTITITYATGNEVQVQAAQVDYEPDCGHYVLTDAQGRPAAVVRAATVLGFRIGRPESGDTTTATGYREPGPVPTIVDEALVRTQVRALLGEHDGQVVTALRREFGAAAR